jgi:uncharacterized protein (DUF1015 family)
MGTSHEPQAACRHPEGSVPNLRPFRALRFEPSSVGDIGAVVAPPYDVIDAATRARLIARHPANVVRLDMPVEEPGDQPDDRYRRAARTLATWRSDGTLRKDPHPSVYAYEQSYRVPGTDIDRTQRGFFARLKLESFGPESGVLPHERTLTAPKEDRYKLLRATGVNTSPVVGLFDDPDEGTADRLAAVAAGPPDVDLTDDDGVRHRLWALPAAGDGPASIVAGELLTAAEAGPITIADGHHRYETALRYRDERRMTRSCEEDPPFDYLLVLMLEATRQDLTVLPTHRLIRGIGSEGAAGVLARARDLFDVETVGSSDDLLARMSGNGDNGPDTAARRFGLWTRDGGAVLSARRSAFEPFLPAGGEALRSLDVSLLGVALEQLAGLDADAVAGGAVDYTKSAADAIAAVDADDGVDAAFLLKPTPVASIEAVAREGDVMPQKSTYFYPKALTGLVINPHEW